MPLRKYTWSVACIFLASLLTSCQLFDGEPAMWNIKRIRYARATAEETSVQVSLHDQQAWLLNGKGQVILKTLISTGVKGKETPQGTFNVLEKIKNKRSNRYGKYVDSETGKVVVEKAWLHRGKPPEGSVYRGIEMPYWMRLTWWGVGMHVGKFPRHTRCSFGCIRVYKDAQPLIYKKTRIGTPVIIHAESLILKMADKE